MKNRKIEFIKKQALVSVITAVVLAGCFYIFWGHSYSWMMTLFVGLSAMGVFLGVVLLMAIFFPKIVIKNYVDDIDPVNYTNVFFYEGYRDGVCRVTKFYGNPEDEETLTGSFSFLNEKGEYITEKWFLSTGEFTNGRCVVAIDDYSFNIIDTEGNFICKKNYPGMSLEIVGGKAKVADGEGGINFVDAQTGDEMWKSYKKEMYYEKQY